MVDAKRIHDGQNALIETAQLEKLSLENEKLKLELEAKPDHTLYPVDYSIGNYCLFRIWYLPVPSAAGG